ncbi:hypothetical protein [Xenorhabdus sp. Sc-CR9]|uniref:hypothetical protein n=1 Tax=Xenorhabdus sp. Sc-CR9 TaxID=2584468 RepID=UPI001F1A19DA|nr:hypothetical protein [Xenorhabdus sp. Sc-CR9]
MKIIIETPEDVNINTVLYVVNDFIKKADKEQNGFYYVQLPEDGMTIKLKMTSAGNIIARVC